MADNCWIAVVYDWGDDGLTVAKTADREVLRAAKEAVLHEARERLSISQDIGDAIVTAIDQTELHRLREVLDRLIPK